jgi:hypothetical protein
MYKSYLPAAKFSRPTRRHPARWATGTRAWRTREEHTSVPPAGGGRSRGRFLHADLLCERHSPLIRLNLVIFPAIIPFISIPKPTVSRHIDHFRFGQNRLTLHALCSFAVVIWPQPFPKSLQQGFVHAPFVFSNSISPVTLCARSTDWLMKFDVEIFLSHFFSGAVPQKLEA